MNPSTSMLAAAAVAASLAPVARAQTAWIQATGGSWATPAAWSAGVPNADTTLTSISGPGTRTVTVSAGVPAANLSIGRLTLGGGGGANTLLVEDLGATPLTASGSVNVDAGGELRLVRSTMSLSLADSAGSWNLNAGVFAALDSQVSVSGGTIRFGRSGAASATLSGGTLTTDGILVVGSQPGSAGTLQLTGSTVTVGDELFIADEPGSSGSVTLAGGRLEVRGIRMRVGDDGIGSLTVQAGALVVDDVSVGRGPTAVGDMTVTGGDIQTGDVSIGRFAGSRGRVEMTGGRWSAPADTIFAGREGRGELVLTGGVMSALELSVGAAAGASGSVMLQGGTLSVGTIRLEGVQASFQFDAGTLETTNAVVTHAAPFVVGDGVRPSTLVLGAGRHVFAGGLVISRNATLTGCGTVEGAITMLGTDARRCGGFEPAAPRLAVASEPGVVVVRFPTEVGAVYRVEGRGMEAGAAWIPVGTEIPGTGGGISTRVPADGAARVLRLVARAAVQ